MIIQRVAKILILSMAGLRVLEMLF